VEVRAGGRNGKQQTAAERFLVQNVQFVETIANEVEKLRETATGKKSESNELKEAEEARIRGG
jgi:hypothetical protein